MKFSDALIDASHSLREHLEKRWCPTAFTVGMAEDRVGEYLIVYCYTKNLSLSCPTIWLGFEIAVEETDPPEMTNAVRS